MHPDSSAQSFIVRVRHVGKAFAEKPVLRDISFDLNKGERLAILGPGGSGKSTLLKTMLGIISPDSGSVEILGKDVFSCSTTERLELLRSIGMAFQQGALFDFMNVRENILFAMENMTDLTPDAMEERLTRMLAAVNLPHAALKLPSELSGGMRRRVGIVRAMATHPQIALLDEPTAGLDPVTSTVVIDMIHALAEQTESSLICVTSSVEVAFTFSKRVALLRDGELIADGDWRQLHQLDNPWITHFLDVRGFSPEATEHAP